MGFFDGFKDFWGRQSTNFKVLLTRDIINTLLGNIAGGFGPIYLKHLGAGTVEIGVLDAVSSLVNTALALPSGLLTDRVKRLKRLYIVGRVLSLPISLIYAAAQSWRVFLFTRVWGTITGRFSGPVMNIISIESLSNRDRVTGLAISRTITSATGILAPMLAAYLITYFGGLDYADSFR
ncbi:MAG: MFS transporter, partial [Candidatus Bathyarchaeia archaeon]